MKIGFLDIQDFITDLIPFKDEIFGKASPDLPSGRNPGAEEILRDLCSKIRRGDEFDMERQVHDIIINNVKYNNSGKRVDHEALGPLLHKSGVCDGISKLAVMVFREIGIQSVMVTGTLNRYGGNQGPHAWNKVRIDGTWYNLDITQDLGMTNGERPIRYDYFNLSDAEISRDHRIHANPIPCRRSGMDYYTRMGLTVSTFSEYRELLKRKFAKGEDSLVVKLPPGLDNDQVKSKLSYAAMQEYGRYRIGKVTAEYSYNPDQRVFHVKVRSSLF